MLRTRIAFHFGAISSILLASTTYPATAQEFHFDLGEAATATKPASPVAQGYIGLSPRDTYDDARGYGWIKPPDGAFDYPLPYPANDLDRDGAIIPASGAVFGLKLPPGQYDVTVHMGHLSPTEWRPGLSVKVGNEYKVRGGMTSGDVLGASFPLTSTGERIELTLCADFAGAPRSTTAMAISVVPHKKKPKTQDFKVKRELQWLTKEGIRGGYGPVIMPMFDEKLGHYRAATPDYRRELKKAHMNSLFANFQGQEGHLDEWVQWAKANNFRIFDVSNFGTGATYTEIAPTLRKVVFGDGRSDITPCPLEERAWQAMMVEPAINHIRQAKKAGGHLEGLAVDVEMYGAKITEIYNNNTCFCADCVSHYAEARKRTLPPEGKAAYDVLKAESQLPDYLAFQEDRLTGILRRASATIRKEDPNFLLGFLQWQQYHWFLRALARGLGTPEVPTLILGENTYYGYNYDAAYQYVALQKMGANAVYVPGLFVNQLSPAGLRDSAIASMDDTGNYWLYNVPVLFAPQNPKETPAAAGRLLPHDYLSNPANEYWEGLRIAGESHRLSPLEAKLTARGEPAARSPREWAHAFTEPVIPDQHATKLEPIKRPLQPVHLFDMGVSNSPVEAGFTPVYYNTMYSQKAGYGWLNRVTGSFDRPDAKPLDSLTRDGLLIGTDNTFRVDLPNGKYEVSLILGDMSPTEPRPFQNVSLNGQKVVQHALTNGGEYRIFSYPVTVTNGKLEVLCEGIGQQRTSIMALMIGKG